ncbi:MAG: sulfotransferase domain-containing protein [Bacteroidales bacterium]|nr:sulfotransferase domain-containing protein [Bacteroidales bacterium]
MTMNQSIIWIASYPKSGNTWCRIFLARFLFGITNINQIAIPIYSSKSFLEDEADIDVSELTYKELHELRLQKFSNYCNESLFPVKIHDMYQKQLFGMPFLPTQNSKAVIYLVRNPFDVAISFSRHLGISIDKTIDIMNQDHYQLSVPKKKYLNQLPQIIGSWSKHIESWLSQNEIPLIIVKYEEMLHRPYETFAKILTFIGKNYTTEKLSDAIHFASFENLSKQEQQFGFEEKSLYQQVFFHTGKSEYYKTILNRNQINTIFENHNSMIKYFNYEPRN